MDLKDGHKKTYNKPILSVHGDLKDITQGRKCCPEDGDHTGGPYSHT